MNKKAKMGFAVSLAVTFGLVLTLALTFPLSCVKAETDPLADNGTSENSSSSAVSGNSTSSKVSSGNPKTSTPENETPEYVKVTLNFNGGTGGDTTRYVPSGTKVGDLATPVKKGYKFAGWESGGNDIMSSYEINLPITLTAQWQKTESESSNNSKSKSSSKSPSSSYKPVDTHQSEVNAAASDAEAAVSDPGVLSSQNWSDILSSGSSSNASSNTGAAGLLSSENSGNSSGGASWLFIAGIALIVLAACGIGLFIYLQFFHTPRNGGHTRKGKDDMDDTADIDSFTDISSDSSGIQQRSGLDGSDESTKPIIMHDSSVRSEMLRSAKMQSSTSNRVSDPDRTKTQPKPAGRVSQRSSVNGRDESTKPVITHGSSAKSEIPRNTKTQSPAVNVSHKAPASGSPKSQAKPVNGAKSDFDWDKFFNDDDI